MSIEESKAELNAYTRQLNTYLFARLGESPEAVRGAGEVMAMMSSIIQIAAERAGPNDIDANMVLATILSTMNQFMEMTP